MINEQQLLCMKNSFSLVEAIKQITAGEISTLEGGASFEVGDFILTGIANEQWVVKADKNNENIPKGYVSCGENIFRSSGNVFKTCEIAQEAGEINASWDSTGKTILKYEFGDYLVKHGEDDIAPCKKEIFEKTYVVDKSKEQILEKLLSFSYEQVKELNEKITVENSYSVEKPINLEMNRTAYKLVKDNIRVLAQPIIKNTL